MKINELKVSDRKLELGPGEFYILDPCYVYPKGKWSDFCHILFKTSGDALFESHQIPFFVFGTAYGDGEYPVIQNGKVIGSCGVDAGLLSIIPIELIKRWKTLKEAKRLGVKITLTEEYIIICEKGICYINDYIVDTVCDSEDDDAEIAYEDIEECEY